MGVSKIAILHLFQPGSFWDMSQNPVETLNGINFAQVLREMLAESDKVSDLIFSPGRPPQVELSGSLKPVAVAGLEFLTPAHTAGIAKAIFARNPKAAETLEEQGSVDLPYSLMGVSRFRCNVFMQRGSIAIVMRVIPNTIPSFETLTLPSVLSEIVDIKNGIVLLTGPTGSGKSSTIAAIIDLINQQKYYHIVTIEDPIEFMHPHKKSTIHQRELYSDTPSFSLALRAALRQAPKVILIGEMRDAETMEIAMEAAETGHLVFSTLHTIDASKTVERIIGVFPKSEEHIIRTRLANSFRFIISQRLIPRSDGQGRVAAFEILKSTMRTREYIEHGEREGKSLIDAMVDGDLEGMRTFDNELERLVKQGMITEKDALSYASNQNNLALKLSELGGRTGAPSKQAKPSPVVKGNGSMPPGLELGGITDNILDLFER